MVSTLCERFNGARFDLSILTAVTLDEVDPRLQYSVYLGK